MMHALVLALSAILGVWKGESLCTVKPGPCTDENVVYYVSAGKKPDAVVLKVDKIVGGEEGLMGVFDCDWNDAKKTLTCPFPKGAFTYRLEGRTLVGKLTLTDGTLFRNVLVKKVD